VDILLKIGADVTQVYNKCNTPLHTATSKGSREIIEILLQYVSHNKLNDFINAKTTSSGTTSLHVLAKNGFLEIVKSLLKHGATYNIENKEGKTPVNLSKDQSVTGLLKLVEELFRDAKKGNVEITNKLRAIEPNEFLAVTNTRDNQGNTLLQVAIVNKHKNIARELSRDDKETRSSFTRYQDRKWSERSKTLKVFNFIFSICLLQFFFIVLGNLVLI
jgi:ankyrin repeat protein